MAVNHWLDPEMRDMMDPLSAEQRATADLLARAYRAALPPPVSVEAMRLWLIPLSRAVERPYPSAAEVLVRAEGVVDTAPDLPILVLNDFSRRAALAQIHRWPSVASVLNILEQERRRLRNRLWALNGLSVAPSPRPAPRDPPDPAEVEAVRAAVAGLVAQLGPGEPDPGRAQRGAMPLGEAALRAAYRAQAGDKDGITPLARDLARARLAALSDPDEEAAS
jgi:hypothetical protein